jgi:hypothetical protein
MSFNHTAAILKKTYCLSPYNLALKGFQSRPGGGGRTIDFILLGLKMAAVWLKPIGWHAQNKGKPLQCFGLPYKICAGVCLWSPAPLLAWRKFTRVFWTLPSDLHERLRQLMIPYLPTSLSKCLLGKPGHRPAIGSFRIHWSSLKISIIIPARLLRLRVAGFLIYYYIIIIVSIIHTRLLRLKVAGFQCDAGLKTCLKYMKDKFAAWKTDHMTTR